MNKEAIRLMRLAHKYQKEALLELIPEDIRGNVITIEKEMKTIVCKCFTGTALELVKTFLYDVPPAEAAPDEKTNTKQTDKIKKVKID